MVKVFKADGKTYYAVTGQAFYAMAIEEAIRHKKDSLKNYTNYKAEGGRLVANGDLIELWREKDQKKGKKCWIITKK